MGRDDAKVVPGLQGGTRAGARLCRLHDRRVAKRPVEQFDTEVTCPNGSSSPMRKPIGEPDNGMFVDQDGNPLPEDQQPRPTAPSSSPPPEDGPALEEQCSTRTGSAG
jgi:penicillin-binding protein 1A